MWMTPDEELFLRSKLNETQKVLEWGCGSSTTELSKIVKEVYSIEHNRDWFAKINQELLYNNNVQLRLCEPDEEYIEGGHGGYYSQVNTYITKPIGLGIFDIIIIDGRARIECSKVCKHISNEDTLIFVHDYRGRYEKENYKLIEDNLLYISEVEQLALLKVKP